jgi:hypothetical protein
MIACCLERQRTPADGSSGKLPTDIERRAAVRSGGVGGRASGQISPDLLGVCRVTPATLVGPSRQPGKWMNKSKRDLEECSHAQNHVGHDDAITP